MKSKLILSLLIASFLLGACSFTKPTPVIETSYINIDGSASLIELGQAWSEHFAHENKGSVFTIAGNNEEAAFAAFAKGTINLVTSTRLMTNTEMDTALAAGLHPVETLVAREAIAVVVNPQNALTQLTVGQVADIFSGRINNWSEVGGPDAPITRIAPGPEAGSSAFFLEAVLHNGITANDVINFATHEEVIAAVQADLNAIAYEDIAYVTPEVKLLSLSRTSSDPSLLPTFDTVNDRSYPLTREIYLYTSSTPIDMIQRYIFWVLHGEGQSTAQHHGLVPILALRPTRTPAP